MSDKIRKCLLAVLLLGVMIMGNFYVKANELQTGETAEDALEETIEDISEDALSEHRTEEEGADVSTELPASGGETEITEDIAEGTDTEKEMGEPDGETNQEQITEERASEEESTEEETKTDTDYEAVEKALGEMLESMRYTNGLPYFLNKYQYDSMIIYMKEYISYMDMQIKIYEEMYDLGEVTETDLQSCKAQKTLAEAELKTAQNESAYYDLYLTENELDYSDYDVRSSKDMEGIAYYRENYPEKDYMTIARYVTDYNNSVIYIEAKQVEIDSLKKSTAMSKMLLKEGEISELEYMEREVSLAKAEYELEQYYVSMNMAYANMILYCR